MMKKNIILLVGIFALSLFIACERESIDPIKSNIERPSDPEGAVVDFKSHPATGHEHCITDHVHGQGFFDINDVEKIDFEFPDGTIEKRYRLDRDIVLTKDELMELQEISTSAMAKQYRTYNLVSNYQTINVLGYSGGSYALSSKMRTALRWAVNNYNALNMGLSFNLSYGTNTGAADIVVYKVNSTDVGGQAGFPSGGNPYKWVQIYSTMNSYNTNVVEHVITHEIGHCLGLRHTDYFNRASCGQNSNEGSGSIGAVHIPGTPTGIDWNSIMLACFTTSEDGEFGYYDRVALEYLY